MIEYTKSKFSKKYFLAGVFIISVALFYAQKAQAASVTSISPSTISPGTTELTIVGNGFGVYNSAGDQVCFNIISGGYADASFCSQYGTDDITSWNDTTIVLTVPEDSGGLMIGGRVHIYNDYNVTDGPYYNVQPVISAIDQTSAPPGSQVKFTGRYFKDSLGGSGSYYLHAYFNGVEATVSADNWTETEIVATIPGGATTGSVSVTFVMVDGSASVTAIGPSITIWTGTTDDQYSSYQQYIKQVSIDQAWSLVGNGKAPIVAVIDDGVYINHPDLRKNIWINKKEKIGNEKDDDKNGFVDDIYGWDFVSNGGEMTVRGTHGTMVAGIIGAINNNSEGITGINPNVKLMPLIVCGSKGCPIDLVTKAIYYAVDNGATIINLSLSTRATTGYKTAYNKAVKYAYDHGVIIVAAAGNGDIESNSGQDLNIIPQSPVCNDIGQNAVIGVGAVDWDNYLTPWSNFGNECLDTYAPGVDIVTTAVAMYNDLIPGSNYGYGDGTSFSAPIVTGIISLLRQKYPYMSNKEVVKRIWAGAEANGVINAYKVLSLPYKPPIISSVSPSAIRTISLTGERTVTITGKNFSKYTVIYFGSTKAKVKLINKTRILATFSLKKLIYGKNLITVIGGNKQESVYRWYKITK